MEVKILENQSVVSNYYATEFSRVIRYVGAVKKKKKTYRGHCRTSRGRDCSNTEHEGKASSNYPVQVNGRDWLMISRLSSPQFYLNSFQSIIFFNDEL